MVDPKEGETICDPASGSGGFLIRAFEIVREKILADADREYNEYRAKIEPDLSLSDADKAISLHEKYEEIFRIGGDEFIIIATNTTESKAVSLLKKIDSKIAKHNSLPSSNLKISASVGYSTTDKISISLSNMLALADKEMYKIKNAKKIQNNGS